MPVSLSALADAHVPAVVAACADWRELAAFGPPYWRPRSEAELRRKVAATAGPAPPSVLRLAAAGAEPLDDPRLHEH